MRSVTLAVPHLTISPDLRGYQGPNSVMKPPPIEEQPGPPFSQRITGAVSAEGGTTDEQDDVM